MKLRLPPEIMDRIEAKARVELRPMSSVVRSELEAYPQLEQHAKLAVMIEQLNTALERLQQIEKLILKATQ